MYLSSVACARPAAYMPIFRSVFVNQRHVAESCTDSLHARVWGGNLFSQVRHAHALDEAASAC